MSVSKDKTVVADDLNLNFPDRGQRGSRSFDLLFAMTGGIYTQTRSMVACPGKEIQDLTREWSLMK